MIELALKARIPIISVISDDPVHEKDVLGQLSGGHVFKEASKNQKPHTDTYYFTHDETVPTSEMYLNMERAESVLVLVNPKVPNALAFDAGMLAAPESMILVHVLAEIGTPAEKAALVQALKGLSIKAAKETVALTAARTGEVTPNSIRSTRALTGQVLVPGLSVVPTTYDFYDVPAALSTWLLTNLPHMASPKLRPRGLLLTGATGVGKSTAPKYIARTLNRPLYRLDIADALDKWNGISEHRVSKALAIIERESPCVLLIDEVEKIFQGTNDVVQRILSQLLWWLAEHKENVLTIMTTNDFSKLPPELYRPGRIDKIMTLLGLTMGDAFTFAVQVVTDVTEQPLDNTMEIALYEVVTDAFDFGTIDRLSHAEIRQVSLDFLKQQANTPVLT